MNAVKFLCGLSIALVQIAGATTVAFSADGSADHPAPAQVEPVPAQGAEPGGQPVHLLVPVERPLPDPARRLPLGVQPGGQLVN